MGGALARDLEVNWTSTQHRYREILKEMEGFFDRGEHKVLRAVGIIRALRLTSPEHFDRKAIRKTREDAREITRALDHLDDLLRSATMGAELRLRLGLDQPGLLPKHAGNAPAGRLMIALQEVRELCEHGGANQPSADQVRIWCARIAFTLLHLFSNKEPTSGSADSPYRALAGLLYEVLTGEQGRDLKRACDDHLRSLRAAEL